MIRAALAAMLTSGCAISFPDETPGQGGGTSTSDSASTGEGVGGGTTVGSVSSGAGGGPGSGGFGGGAGGDAAASTSTATSTSTGVVNCGTECGPTELCDGVHGGLDDNCDGNVDEGCPCAFGAQSDCFKGDPGFRAAAGCFPGSMQCTEFGEWGACEGGAHAFGEAPCQEGSLEGCHAISAVPFAITDLSEGTGIFDDDADPGSETYDVACPDDVGSCPTVQNETSFQALQSGEYTVTYTKLVDGREDSCSYPLFVGARGLRVELTWNYGPGTDLDLHMMRPGVATEFAPGGSPDDCAFDNCRIDNGFPEWFPATAPEGDPVAWYLDPVDELNSCYFAPRGYGQQWRDNGQGCHNPRLDLDNITCSPSVTDPNSGSFCAPENVNIDFPTHDQWTRVGVVHYSGNPNQPTLKIFCDGALKSVLGPTGFATPVNLSGSLKDQLVWIAADVAFVTDECSTECFVRPIYDDPDAQTPLILALPAAGPDFPPLPGR